MSLFTWQRVPVHGFIILACLVSTVWIWKSIVGDHDEFWNWTCWYKLAWLFPLPYTIVSFLGLNVPECTPRPITYKHVKALKICYVSKGTNANALARSLRAAQEAVRKHQSPFTFLRVYLVVDTPVKMNLSSIEVVVVPKNFRPTYAQYKSRALEYFRRFYVHNDTWVLHMDEESILNDHTLRECVRFIHREDYKMGQGVILYNAYQYNVWSLFSIADALRVSDDLGRFRFQFNVLHKPIFGVHGSFLLVSGFVENLVTWDHEHAGNLTEDYAFAIQCIQRGISCGSISAVVREVSPQSVMDFMRQRRRWLLGILSLPYGWPRAMGVLWILGTVTYVATYVHIALSLTLATPSTPLWLGVLSAFSFVTSTYMYVLGVWIHATDLHASWIASILCAMVHVLFSIVLLPVVSLLETVSVYFALSTCRRTKTFDVIKK